VRWSIRRARSRQPTPSARSSRAPTAGSLPACWEREPDTWSFERPYHEVALILQARAEIETPEGDVLEVGPGDVLITPKGSKGTWRIHETLVQCDAMCDA
jgi:uncharacterized cupin superfamily protein